MNEEFAGLKVEFEMFAEFQGSKRQSIRAVFKGAAEDGQVHRFMVRYGIIDCLAKRSIPGDSMMDHTTFRNAGVSKKVATEILKQFDAINDAIDAGKDYHHNYPLVRFTDYSKDSGLGVYLTAKPVSKENRRHTNGFTTLPELQALEFQG